MGFIGGKTEGVFWAGGTSITGCQRDCLPRCLPRESIDVELAQSPKRRLAWKWANVVKIIEIRCRFSHDLERRPKIPVWLRYDDIDSRDARSRIVDAASENALDSITAANEFIRTTRRPASPIVSYLNELSNVFSLNTACGENYYPRVSQRHRFCYRAAVNINKKDRFGI